MFRDQKDLILTINQLLDSFFSEKKRQAEKLNDETYTEIVDRVDSLAMLGKDRIRPLLVIYGFKLFTGKTNTTLQQAINISLAVELFHTAALIHDDIMDEAKIRRGKPSVNEYFKKRYNNNVLAGNLAILAGDLALIWADELFYDAELPTDIFYQAKKYFNLLREEVIFGQTLDLLSSCHCEATKWPWQSKTRTRLPRSLRSLAMTNKEENIYSVYVYKTAKYSFERPLYIGAVLAGADNKRLQLLSDFAIPVGTAFQLQDDILGVLGDKKITGKDVDSDIKEGKKTLLMYNVECRINNEIDRQRFNNILGNKNASDKDIKWIKNIIKKKNVFEKCRHTARELINQGKKALLEYNKPLDSESKKFLLDLADYCVTRED